MRLDDYHERDGKKVWLSNEEIAQFIDEAQNGEQRLAFLLGARSGLRRSELLQVTTNNFHNAPDGFLRIWEDYSKGEKYREVPVPSETENVVDMLAYDRDPDETLIGTEYGNTVYRWVRRAAERRQAATNDPGWQFLDVHDLRRSWGNQLLWEHGVLPSTVMAWGGWEDWETFRDHYLGEMSPEAAQRERAKIDYMGGSPPKDDSGAPTTVFEPQGSRSRNPTTNHY